MFPWRAKQCSARFALPLVLLLILLLGAPCGCPLFQPRPLAVASEFLARQPAAPLLDPTTRSPLYARLFPPLAKVQFYGDFTARNPFRRGTEYLQLYYFALTDGGDTANPRGPRSLRLQVTKGSAPLLAVIVSDSRMAILKYPPPQKLLFIGPLSNAGSPISRAFGFEPWDLAAIFTIGQVIAGGSMITHHPFWGREITLTPAAPDQPLRRVVLDGRTGLPRQAVWKSAGNTFQVDYLGWGYFTDSLTEDQTRLAPTRVEIHRPWSRTVIGLELKDYQFNRNIPPLVFQLPDDPGFLRFPLEAFDKWVDQP